jgi:hypothetical protein
MRARVRLAPGKQNAQLKAILVSGMDPGKSLNWLRLTAGEPLRGAFYPKRENFVRHEAEE